MGCSTATSFWHMRCFLTFVKDPEPSFSFFCRTVPTSHRTKDQGHSSAAGSRDAWFYPTRSLTVLTYQISTRLTTQHGVYFSSESIVPRSRMPMNCNNASTGSEWVTLSHTVIECAVRVARGSPRWHSCWRRTFQSTRCNKDDVIWHIWLIWETLRQ